MTKVPYKQKMKAMRQQKDVTKVADYTTIDCGEYIVGTNIINGSICIVFLRNIIVRMLIDQNMVIVFN